MNISRILKFLTWHVFGEFGWNDPNTQWSLSTAIFGCHLLRKSLGTEFLVKKVFPQTNWKYHSVTFSDFQMEILQGISQNIKIADIFSKLGNYTSIYQRSPPWLTQIIFLLAQPIEHWKMPSWEKNISEHDIKCTQITTDKCFCSQVAIKQSTVFFLWMIALKTNLEQIGKFKYLWKWCIIS